MLDYGGEGGEEGRGPKQGKQAGQAGIDIREGSTVHHWPELPPWEGAGCPHKASSRRSVHFVEAGDMNQRSG